MEVRKVVPEFQFRLFPSRLQRKAGISIIRMRFLPFALKSLTASRLASSEFCSNFAFRQLSIRCPSGTIQSWAHGGCATIRYQADIFCIEPGRAAFDGNLRGKLEELLRAF